MTRTTTRQKFRARRSARIRTRFYGGAKWSPKELRKIKEQWDSLTDEQRLDAIAALTKQMTPIRIPLDATCVVVERQP